MAFKNKAPRLGWLAADSFADRGDAATQLFNTSASNPHHTGTNFIFIREDIYTEAFPVFIGKYPSISTVYLPPDGPIAFTLHAELGEATA
ncbi:uncharacterized protein N7498_000693 [Penicillium cinerascens]|uniref:Uncharacterized protein n=1 Tax=Penicillium cinerascens TaxID=70096 RepID=A0A9W9NET7_9EURO|nr:uncharacterized protein N7498_000693 [Penicillium cinerascens]KAJ5218594.1 hypothetical protein N7498_000693 [Penicillium cinerascens]